MFLFHALQYFFDCHFSHPLISYVLKVIIQCIQQSYAVFCLQNSSSLFLHNKHYFFSFTQGPQTTESPHIVFGSPLKNIPAFRFHSGIYCRNKNKPVINLKQLRKQPHSTVLPDISLRNAGLRQSFGQILPTREYTRVTLPSLFLSRASKKKEHISGVQPEFLVPR